MSRTRPASSARPPHPRSERLFVLGPAALAAVLGAPAGILFDDFEINLLIWLCAAIWLVPASLACALARGLRHGDWSAFTHHDHEWGAFGSDDKIDFDTRTGSYAWMRERDEQMRFNGHDHHDFIH